MTRAHSTDSTFAGTANAGSFDPSITPDGSRVCFSTDATNFLTGGLNGNRQIVRVSRATNSVRSLVSQSAGGAQANGNCYEPSISSDGTKVAFFTLASNLGPTDSNGFFDVYLRDVTNNTVSRMSLDSGGGDSNGHSGFPSISGDGSVVAFASLATDLVAGDTNGVFDVFSRTGEVTTRTSLSTAGGEANVDSDLPAISQNGRYIAFRSAATNLITKDALADDDIVIRDQTTPSTFWGTIRCTFPATWPGFAAPINMTAGNAARAVTPGDFNGDGNLDLASTNQSSSNVGIYLGNGSGNFGTPTTYAVGSNPRGISTGDFNHDGDLDLAVSNSGVSNDISILLGDGLGVFVAQTSLTVSGAIWAANGDLNGDGNIDLAVASSGATASVFFGNGTGSFGPATDYALTGQGYSVVDADFDNDGDLDLALVNFSSPGYAAVLLNNGDGTYAARSDYPLAGSGYSLATADMNGDKSLDLVATSTSPSRVAVLLNNGDGTFGTATNYTAGLNPFGVTTGDFDGDGDQDVAVANFSDTFVSLFLNNGDGTLATPTSLTVGTGASSLSAADLDNDGDLDLAVSNQQTNRILVFLNQASP